MQKKDAILYTEQLRAYFKEVAIYFVALFLSIAHFPVWAPVLAWGVVLLERAEKLGLLDKLWKKYFGKWEDAKVKEFEKDKN